MSPPTLSRARAFTRAGLDSHGQRVRFHSLRKYLYDRLTAVASQEKAKQIIGKKVNEADAPYLGVENLRDIYARATPSIVVGNGNGAEVKQRVGSLEEENKTLREELAKLNTKVEGMSTEKQAVLADLRGLNTDQLKALMSMADQFNQKKRKEPMVKVNVTEETEKGVRQNE